MWNNVYYFMVWKVVLVIAEEKKHDFKIDNRKEFTKGHICNYETFHLTTVQYVLYTCVHSYNCFPREILRFPQLDFDNCPHAFHPPIVGEYVCCHPADNNDIQPNDTITLPSSPSYVPGFRSAFKCNEYAQLGCLNAEDCPILPQRRKTTKGHDTVIGKYPYLALVGWYNEQTKEQTWYCLGSIITEKYILSAASCTATTHGRNSSHVRVGVDVLCKVGVDCPLSTVSQEIPIERHIFHPKVLLAWYYHDIILFKLSRDIKFNRIVRPACLFGDMGKALDSGQFAMYDELTSLERTQRELIYNVPTPHEAEMRIVSAEDCRLEHATDHRLIDGKIDPDYMFCAGIEGDFNYPCILLYEDEFGGPLVIQEENPHCIWKIFGVMGWFQTGGECGHHIHPVFTRVPYYLEWIEDIVYGSVDMYEKVRTLPSHCYDSVTPFTVPSDGRCTPLGNFKK